MKRIAAVVAAACALTGFTVVPAGAAAAVGAARPAFAKDAASDPSVPERRTIRQARPRIEVHPAQLLYRECVDTTREVWRPYWGYVVMPSMRCWWVRR